MKNYRDELYPDLTLVIKKAESTYKKIVKRLQDPSCAHVQDLFELKENKNIRNKEIFKLLACEPNSEESKNDIKGLYILGEKDIETGKFKPVYVGISRKIISRIKNHSKGSKHNQATLAYLIAKFLTGYKGKREDFELKTLKKHQKSISQYKIVVIPVESDFELYFMEVYLAGRLKTKWNSFRTH